MPRRYLFGPVTRAYADQKLHAARQRHECLAFDISDGSDLTIGLGDSWADVCARLPPGWQPDFIALYLPYQSIPACLWAAPVPLVGLAADWNLLWHWYRRCLAACDLVLTDTVGVETLARQGIHHARVANLYGCERVYLESPPSAPKRDIDVFFAGNFNPAVQRERLPWLGRVAAFADRWKVVLAKGVFDDDYRALLARARIVFNRGVRGECNMRTFEAAAAGALLFQEAENREIGNYFQDRQEFVAYRSEDFEDLLSYYLEHEVARRGIADAGRRRAREYGFAQLWDETLMRSFDITGGGSTSNLLSGHAGKRQTPAGTPALLMRSWELAQTTRENDPTFAADIEKAVAANPSCAALHHAHAATLAHEAKGNQSADWSPIVHALREALRHDPTHAMASLNLAEVFRLFGQVSLATEQAKRTLALLDRHPGLSAETLDAPRLPYAYDQFHVQWERSAWNNAGNPAAEAVAKQTLLRWRLHSLLANLTGDVWHWYQAELVQPDLPPSRAALGCALAQSGKFSEAVPFLARAVSDNPFDAVSSRVYFDALCHCRDTTGQRRRVARDRRLLAEAAPTVVVKEPWFMEEPPAGH
jgi:Glycosyl transferases group 1